MSTESSEFEPVFIRFRGRTQGPFGLDQLLALHKRGQFSRAHEVSEDRLNWRPAATLETVFPRTTKASKSLAKTTEMDLTIDIDTSTPNPSSLKPVKPVWHYSVGKESYGPVTLIELRGLFTNGQLDGSDLVWKDGMEAWIPASELTELQAALGHRSEIRTQSASGSGNYCFACGAATDPRAEVCPKCGVRQRHQNVTTKDRNTAALFAFFLGGIGAHHFYLGNVGLGLLYVLFCWTFIPALIALIEAICFLCMSDASFAARYNLR